MLQKVIEQMMSPLSRTQSVLTLACGHLWSWSDAKPPEEIDCIHCDRPSMPDWLDTPGLRAMDLAVRNLRRSRYGLPPLQPEGKTVQ